MKLRIFILVLGLMGLAGCQVGDTTTAGNPGVLAVETFLADMTQNVAGGRGTVDTLIPPGLDPHAFEPTPRDVVKITGSRVLVVNGAGLEEWLEPVLANAGGERLVIVASEGLQSRTAREGEAVEGSPDGHTGSEDPHFWLDPLDVIRYVENIRDGLAKYDPAGKELYTQNAAAYIQKLRELDAWIKQQVAQIPADRRLLVTNHESLGYFADRYGFKIVGTLLPGVSTNASPSAQQLARLIDQIRASKATAIFLETGSSTQLAQQVASETGVKVVTELKTHSVTLPDGSAASYIDMMKANTLAIVNALK